MADEEPQQLPTIQTLMHNNDFLNLKDVEAKREILSHVDQDFRGLGKEEQDKILEHMQPRSLFVRALRATPATAGMLIGGAAGAAAGAISPVPGAAFLGGALGAGAGSALGEGALALYDRAVGNLEGEQNPISRMDSAAGQGVNAYETGEMLGVPLKYGAGKVVEYGGRALKYAESKIPLGVLEGAGNAAKNDVLDWLARFPGGNMALRSAAQTQSGAIIKAGQDTLDNLGGSLEYGPAATAVSRSLRDTGRKLIEKANDPADLKSLGDLGLDDEINGLKESLARFGATPQTKQAVINAMENKWKEGAIADTMAKDPVKWAMTTKDIGADGIDELRRAWLTGVLDSATGKEGKIAGLINPRQITDAWDKLGQQGQERLFGELKDDVGGFMDSIRPAEVSRLMYMKAQNAMKSGITGQDLKDIIKSPLTWTGLRELLTMTVTHGPIHAATDIGANLMLPWVAAKLLATKGGAGLLANTLGHEASGRLPDAMPYLSKALVQMGPSLKTSWPELQRALAEPVMHGVEEVMTGHAQGRPAAPPQAP